MLNGQAARGIRLLLNSYKTKFMPLNQDGSICSLNHKPLKLVDPFVSLGSNISSTESEVNIWKKKGMNDY